MGGLVEHNAAQAGGVVIVPDDQRRKTHAVVRLAEARVVGVANELIDWRAVAVGGVKVTVRIKAHSERVHLPEGKLLHAGAVELHAVGVAGVHSDARAVGGIDGGVVVEPVCDVEPAVEPARERRLHAVRVTLVAKRAVELGAFVRAAVAVGVPQKPDVGNTPRDDTILVRVDSGGDVEAVGEGGELVVTPVAVGVLEYLDRVAAGLAKRHGVRILERTRDPEAAALVEREIHRLANVRAGGDQFHLEPVRHIERLEAFPDRERFGLAHQRLEVRPTERIRGLRLAKREHRRKRNNDSQHESARLAVSPSQAKPRFLAISLAWACSRRVVFS